MQARWRAIGTRSAGDLNRAVLRGGVARVSDPCRRRAGAGGGDRTRGLAGRPRRAGAAAADAGRLRGATPEQCPKRNDIRRDAVTSLRHIGCGRYGYVLIVALGQLWTARNEMGIGTTPGSAMPLWVGR